MYRKRNAAIEFIDEHKVAILITTLTVVSGIALASRYGIRQHNQFLKAEGLYDKFYELTD
jgi:hypothetical protein